MAKAFCYQAVAALLYCALGVICSQHPPRSGHTNNWAVLICSSRYWFNYRHIANTLSIYHSVKRLGIPDSHIILMLADDMACNPRNAYPAKVFNNYRKNLNVYGDDVEVDYKGYEVTVANFLRILTGRLDHSVPRSKRLLSDDRSNILVYMTGHGGENFLKFQDSEEISNTELGDAFEQMWQKKRYHELMFIIDTCQGVSMYRDFYSPNILAVSSSHVGEDSLSHHSDEQIGVHIIDSWTYYALEFLNKVTPKSQATMQQFFDSFNPKLVKSNPGIRKDLFRRDLRKVLVTDFFGSVRNVELHNHTSRHTPSRSGTKSSSHDPEPSAAVLVNDDIHLNGSLATQPAWQHTELFLPLVVMVLIISIISIYWNS
ncbi:GPI-anchor transamidase-like isoform X2 [Dysidea avara]|uniref:GPI-anchor transamidase-like isoform X2 n=1 Tax=Dysidea avara TaxID=196820 RepID=UPI003321BC15